MKTFDLEVTDSSVITRIKYFSDNGVDYFLHVKFVSGALWEYRGVPGHIAQEFAEAASKGNYFCKNIKGRYTSLNIPENSMAEHAVVPEPECDGSEKYRLDAGLKMPVAPASMEGLEQKAEQKKLSAIHSAMAIDLEDRQPVYQRFRDRKLHCEDGPAVKLKNGTEEWWVNGVLHREDGPAIERADGSKEWWVKGLQHRENGPAIVMSGGRGFWFLDGELIDPERHYGMKRKLDKYLKTEKQAEVAEKTEKKPEAPVSTTESAPNDSVLNLKVGQKVPVGYSGKVRFPDGSLALYQNGEGSLL